MTCVERKFELQGSKCKWEEYTAKHMWMCPIVLSIHSFINIPNHLIVPSFLDLKILLESPSRRNTFGYE
jgi:hypothetical protein